MLNSITKMVQRRFVGRSLFNNNSALQKSQFSTTSQARNFHNGAVTSNQSDIFKELGINKNDIEWPIKSDSNDDSVNYRDRNPYSIENMYGNSDLAQLPVFKKLINFGLWRGIGLDVLSDKKRERSSKRLYCEVAEESYLIPGHGVICDVGCGNGIGTAEDIVQRYRPAVTIGVDSSEKQIQRANLYNQEIINKFTINRLNFIQASAEHLPFKDNSFTNVIAVESPHHFNDLDQFFSEAARILQPKTGRLVFTTFFPNDERGVDIINKVIPDANMHCSNVDISTVKKMLSKHMDNVEVKSIGEDVWWGLHCWLKHIGYEKQWTALWWPLYENGVLDYYIVKAEAPCNTADNDKQHIENSVESNEIDDYDNDEENEESYTPSLTM